MNELIRSYVQQITAAEKIIEAAEYLLDCHSEFECYTSDAVIEAMGNTDAAHLNLQKAVSEYRAEYGRPD